MTRECPYGCGGFDRDNNYGFHESSCRHWAEALVRPVSRTAPTEPPPPYGAMPAAKPAPHVHKFHQEHLANRIACSGCDLTISGLELAAIGYRHQHEAYHDPARNALADECGRLRDQVRDLEAENSRLCRDVERLTRKGGGR